MLDSYVLYLIFRSAEDLEVLFVAQHFEMLRFFFVGVAFLL